MYCRTEPLKPSRRIYSILTLIYLAYLLGTLASTVRPSKVASFYFQRRPSRSWINHTSKTDLVHAWHKFLLEQELKEDDDVTEGCNGPNECGSFDRNQLEETVRQSFIESFKKRLLEHMNLPEVPNVNKSAWSAVPFVIQQQLKARVDVNNRVTEGPVPEEEEKEAIFMLQPDTFGVNYLTFTLTITEPMDERQIVYGRIHAENMEGIPSNIKFALWEIIPPESSDPQYGEEIEDEQTPESFTPPELQQQAKLLYPVLSVSSAQEIYNFRTVSFDITRRLKKWIKLRKWKQGHEQVSSIVKHLLIVCSGRAGEGISIDPQKVVLDVRYSPTLRRRRRSVGIENAQLANRCQDGGHHITCCTQPLVIKFSEIGWDNWIVFPDKVEANYCRGTCQLRGFRSAHYEMLTLLQQANKSRFDVSRTEETRSCCYPTKRNDFSILHLDAEEKVNMLTLHGLIVLGCGCS